MKKKQKAKRALTSRVVVKAPSSFAFPLLRTFLLASIGVVASAYGLWRYYTVKRPPMVAPIPAATEIPIELE